MKEEAALGVASFGGVGYFPWAPGTAGALVGTAVAIVTQTHPAGQWGLLAAAVLLGLLFIPIAQRHYGTADPKPVVLDEIAGILLAFAGLPLTPTVLVMGFVVFRLLDIAKPWPIRRLESLPGAFGVLADDLAAGLLTRLLVGLLLRLG